MAENKPIIPEHFAQLLGYCDHRMHTIMDRKLRKYDITPMQCRTLMYLFYQEGDVNQRMLERFLMVQPSTVNGIVNRLEEKGFVRRENGIQDGRCRILHPTEAGNQFREELMVVMEEVIEIMEKGLTKKQVQTLYDLLLRVSYNVGKEVTEN